MTAIMQPLLIPKASVLGVAADAGARAGAASSGPVGIPLSGSREMLPMPSPRPSTAPLLCPEPLLVPTGPGSRPDLAIDDADEDDPLVVEVAAVALEAVAAVVPDLITGA